MNFQNTNFGARIFTIFATTAALSSLIGCSKAPEVAPTNAPHVSKTSVEFPATSPQVQRLLTEPVVAAQNNSVSLPGRIVWDEDHTSRIAPPVAGRLDSVTTNGQLGSLVKGNEVLAFLTSPELGQAQADAVRAQAQLKLAEQNCARLQELFSGNSIAEKDLQQAQLDLASAHAEAERSQLRLNVLGGANVVDQRLPVRSPIAGVIVERNTNPNMEWRPDQVAALFVVSDPTYLWCWLDAPERMLDVLHTGMKVAVHTAAFPTEIFQAQIDYIGDALDPVSRTLKVRARLHNPQRHLKGDMYVTADIVAPAQALLDVPVKAVFLNGSQQQVFVKASDSLFVRKTIVPISSNDNSISIASGLNKGDNVVTDGALYLEKIIEDKAASADSNTNTTAAASVASKPNDL